MAKEPARDKEIARDKETNKEKAIEMAVSQIEKQFGKGAIMRLGVEGALVHDIAVIPTGSGCPAR